MTSVFALSRAAFAGAATGSRSMSAIAACALTAPPTPGAVDRWLRKSIGTRATVLAAAGELVVDKLPKSPPRTQPPALVARLALGALSAGVLAGRRHEPAGLAAAVGATAAAATAFGGIRVRAAAAERFGGDLRGALAEDVVALALAATAARLP